MSSLHQLASAVAGHPTIRTAMQFKELIGLVIALFAFVLRPIWVPALVVEYELLTLTPPSSIGSLPIDSILQFPARSDSDTAFAIAASPELMIVDVFNSSNQAINDLELSFWNSNIVAVGMRSSSFRMGTSLDSLSSVRMSGQVAYLPNLTYLPPKGFVRLYLWGRIAPGTYFDPAIRVDASIKHIRVRPQAPFAGFPRFVAENLAVITFLTLIALLLIGLRRRERSRD